jgi:hypothetical protein
MRLKSIAVDFRAAFLRWWYTLGQVFLCAVVLAAYVLYKVHHG